MQRWFEFALRSLHTEGMLKIQNLIDTAKCYETVRQMRWPAGIACPHCTSQEVTKRGRDDTQPQRQRYQCGTCGRHFDDLTGTIFAGHPQPVRTWILCLYLMGLNLSNQQIAQELDLNKDDVQQMTCQLRAGIVASKLPVRLSGEVECEEVYVVAGHKGHPEAGQKKGGQDVATDSKGPEAGGRSSTRNPRSLV